MKTKDKKSIVILLVLALVLIVSFLFIGVNSNNIRYALYRRIPKIYAIILTGGAIGFSSLIFQTVTNNRILTPSILGIDSLYVLLQTSVVFFPKDENIGEVTITRSYIEGTGGPLISLRGQEVPRLP